MVTDAIIEKNVGNRTEKILNKHAIEKQIDRARKLFGSESLKTAYDELNKDLGEEGMIKLIKSQVTIGAEVKAFSIPGIFLKLMKMTSSGLLEWKIGMDKVRLRSGIFHLIMGIVTGEFPASDAVFEQALKSLEKIFKHWKIKAFIASFTPGAPFVAIAQGILNGGLKNFVKRAKENREKEKARNIDKMTDEEKYSVASGTNNGLKDVEKDITKTKTKETIDTIAAAKKGPKGTKPGANPEQTPSTA